MSTAKRGRGGGAGGAPSTPSSRPGAADSGTANTSATTGGDSGRHRTKADGTPKGEGDKSRSGELGGGWGKGSGAPRTQGSNGIPPKAKAMTSHMGSLARVPHNVAALAARNLGGFVPNKIFVGGVPITCTEEQFSSYFEPYGSISKIELHALRGFGYVTYENVESVDACLEKYEEHYLCKKWVEVKRSIPRELIDSYEKEQRRLLSEMSAESDFNEPSTHKSHSHSGSGGASNSKGDNSAANTASSSGASGKARTASQGGSGGGAGDGEVISAWGLPPAGNKADASPKWGQVRDANEPSGTVAMSRIQQLKEMGFSEAVARRVLGECVWDVNKAIDRLLLEGVPEDLDEDEEDTSADPPLGAPPPPKDEAPPPPTAWGRKPATTSPTPGSPAKGSLASTVDPALPGTTGLPAATPPWGAARTGPPSPNRGAQTPAQGGLPAAAAGPRSPKPAPSTPQGERVPKSPSHRTGQSTEHASVAMSAAMDEPVVVEPKAEPAMKMQKQEPKQPKAAQIQAELASHEAAEEIEQPGGYPSTSNVPLAAPPIRHAQLTVKKVEPEPVEEATPAPPAEKAPEVSEGGPPLPQKEIRRVARSWPAEDATQLGVEDGDFVEIWVDSQTQHGWIHAERTGENGPLVGWLPAFVLEALPEEKKWMRIVQKWTSTDESQCDVQEGVLAQVWMDTRTNEGWTYVEVPDAAGVMKPGWLPEFCLDWKKDK